MLGTQLGGEGVLQLACEEADPGSKMAGQHQEVGGTRRGK